MSNIDNPRFTNEYITGLSATDLLKIVLDVHDALTLREIAGYRFPGEASMENGNDTAPFVRWPAINKEPYQPWLPVAVAKLALADFGEPDVVITVPRSATWYRGPILDAHIFPHSHSPLVLKQSQIQEQGLKIRGTVTLEVPSYVHNRHPATHQERGTQTVFFFEPESYRGKTVLIIDDAIAEGISTRTVASFLKESLGADRVFVAAPMAKKIQGGLDKLHGDHNIAGVSVLVTVTKTRGYRGAIEFE